MYTTGYHYSRALRIFTHTLSYQTLSLHYILTYLHPDIVRIMSSIILTPTYQRIMDLAVHIYRHTIDIHDTIACTDAFGRNWNFKGFFPFRFSFNTPCFGRMANPSIPESSPRTFMPIIISSSNASVTTNQASIALPSTGASFSPVQSKPRM